MTLEGILGRLAAAGVDTGHLVSPNEARRLAARHGVIPAVLGSESVVLDFGRRRRFYSDYQRIALRIRHTTCSVRDAPSPQPGARHTTWTRGYPATPARNPAASTSTAAPSSAGLTNRLIDHPGYHTTHRTDGTTTITRIRR